MMERLGSREDKHNQREGGENASQTEDNSREAKQKKKKRRKRTRTRPEMEMIGTEDAENESDDKGGGGGRICWQMTNGPNEEMAEESKPR